MAAALRTVPDQRAVPAWRRFPASAGLDPVLDAAAAAFVAFGYHCTTMREIVASVKRVTDIVGEISSASQEQRSGIEEVSHAVTQLDDATQQNAALVEQAAAAAQSLEEQAVSLTQVVAQFRLDAHALRAPAMVARVEPAVAPVKPVALATPKIPI